MLFQYIVCELYSMYSISYGVKPIHASAFTNKGNTLYGALDVFSVLHMSIPWYWFSTAVLHFVEPH